MKLKAKNSNGNQTFKIEREIEDNKPIYFATLWGKYRGEDIQIDFDQLSHKKMKKLLRKLKKLVKGSKKLIMKNPFKLTNKDNSKLLQNMKKFVKKGIRQGYFPPDSVL